MITVTSCLRWSLDGPAAGTPDCSRSVLAPLLSHAAARTGQAPQFDTKPAPRGAAGTYRANPPGARDATNYPLGPGGFSIRHDPDGHQVPTAASFDPGHPRNGGSRVQLGGGGQPRSGVM